MGAGAHQTQLQITTITTELKQQKQQPLSFESDLKKLVKDGQNLLAISNHQGLNVSMKTDLTSLDFK